MPRPRQHPVLNIHELLEQTLLFLTSPCDLLHMALVCRSFLGVALRVLWRCHQFSLGLLLRCAPKPILGHHSESEDNVSSSKTYKILDSYVLASLESWLHHIQGAKLPFGCLSGNMPAPCPSCPIQTSMTHMIAFCIT